MSLSIAGSQGEMHVPTASYEPSILSTFPKVSSKYLVESSIGRRYRRDYLSVNGSAFTGEIADGYVEFIVPATDGEFTNLNNLCIEIKVELVHVDGGPLTLDDVAATQAVPAFVGDRVVPCDGFMHRLLKGHTVHIGGVQVESSPYFGMLNVIKTYTNYSKGKLSTVGENMGYADDIPPLYREHLVVHDETRSKSQKRIDDAARRVGGIHLHGPVNLDIGSCDTLLVDGLDMRLRFEFESPELVLNSHQQRGFRYKVTRCKLWVTRMIPHPSALLALNKSLNIYDKTLDYLFDKPLCKKFVWPGGQDSIICENVFQNVIPTKLIIVLQAQAATNGTYGLDPNYFGTVEHTGTDVSINGIALAAQTLRHPNELASVFHETIEALGLENNHHTITRANFGLGRSIFVYDTRPTDSEDTISLEQKGSLRVQVTGNVAGGNVNVFIIGYTTAVLKVNGDRRVFVQYL